MIAFSVFSFLLFFTDCTPDLYVQLPYQVYYTNPGDQLCIVCSSTAISIQTKEEAFVTFVIAGSNQPFCNTVPGCYIDGRQDRLCFNEGVPTTSFGSYVCRHYIDINSACDIPFNITKASKPPLFACIHYLLSPNLSESMQLVEAHYLYVEYIIIVLYTVFPQIKAWPIIFSTPLT